MQGMLRPLLAAKRAAARSAIERGLAGFSSIVEKGQKVEH